MKRKLFPLLAVALLLTACASGPDYRRPETEAPSAFKEASDWKTAEPRDALPRNKWWEAFGDATLNKLQEQVELSNQNLRLAEAQYRQAQALAQSARAGLFPTFGAALSKTRSGMNNERSAKSDANVTDYAFNLNASWEIDLWGRLRRIAEAGKASAAASAADLESARLSLHSTLAQNYFLLREADREKQLLEETASAYEKSLELTRNRYAAGVATAADVAQAETQFKTTRAQAINLGIQRAQLEHAIALLLGKAPADFSLAPATSDPQVPYIPPGLPSQLLERRPDIAASERRVAAANAQIGAAEAAFFPSLTLTAAGGFQNDNLANWFTLPNRFWSFGPTLAQSLFDGGLRRAQSEQAQAAYDASVAAYRQAVLTGFQEVEDNLAALRILEQEAQVQDEALEAARRSVKLTTNQYLAGTVSYLNVVTVQAAALTSERTALDIQSRRLTASVQLIKALGGGWDTSRLAKQ